MTYSNSLGGEHATTVNGNGLNPGLDEIIEVASNIGLNKKKARVIALEIKESTKELSKYCQ